MNPYGYWLLWSISQKFNNCSRYGFIIEKINFCFIIS